MSQILAQQQRLGFYNVAGLNETPRFDFGQLNIINKTSWDLNDDFTVKNIFGYSEIQNSAFTEDIDGTVLPLTQQPKWPI